jgi:hypothetical protein
MLFLGFTLTWAVRLVLVVFGLVLGIIWNQPLNPIGILIICFKSLRQSRFGTRRQAGSWSIIGRTCLRIRRFFVCPFPGLVHRIITGAEQVTCFIQSDGLHSDGFNSGLWSVSRA